MSWNLITGYLERFKNIKPPKQFTQDSVADAVKSVLGVLVDSEKISVQGNVLRIKNISPAVKNEIFMRKDLILKQLSEKLGRRAPKEIRF